MTDQAVAPRAASTALVGNPVLLTLVAVAGIAVAMGGFVAYAPNRLVSGRPIALWAAAPGLSTAGIATLGMLLPAVAFAAPRRALYWGQTIAAAALLLLVLAAAGAAARAIAGGAPLAARVSPGVAFWTLAACAVLAIGDALQRLDCGPGIRLLVVAAVAGGVLALAETGSFAALSIAREYAARQQVFAEAVMRHIMLVAAGVGPALAIGFPLGVAVVRVPRRQGPVFAVLNIVQTVPSIALFGLLIAPLSALAAAAPALAALGVAGIGVTPAVIALVLYALLPVVRNTAAGLGGVDRATIEAGRGMGMTAAQLFCPGRIAAGAAGAARRVAHRRRPGDRPRRRRRVDRRRRARHLCLRRARPVCGRSGSARRAAGDLPGACRRFRLADDLVDAAPPGGAMIEIDAVTKRYDGRTVVDNLSLNLPEGEFCVLLGSSGCGKSTTLRMINRLIPIDAGMIRIGGEDIGRLPVEALRRGIGYAIQSIGLFPHWSVADNIATVPRLLKWPAARVRQRVDALLDLFRLDPASYRGKYPHQLSGGEQQRVGVARALAADPEVLLMDEPFAAVDPITRDALQAELAHIQQATRKTIVFVTHDIDEALRLATRIAILNEGRIVQFGRPLEILEHPANDFVGDFVGRQGLGLKLLSVRKVAERLRHGEDAEGEPVPLDASLREALSAMTARHTDRLPVEDAAGRRVGVVTLADLVR